MQSFKLKEFLKDELSKKDDSVSIFSVYEKLYRVAKGNVVITNLINTEQTQYYCLVIKPNKLEYIEKSGTSKTKIVFDINTSSLYINGNEISKKIDQFSRKLNCICDDVNNKKSKIYRSH